MSRVCRTRRDVLRHEDAEIIGVGLETGDRRRDRRDRAITFELERLVGQHRERAQAVAADHVGLLYRELRGDLGLAGDGRDNRRIAAIVGHVLVGETERASERLDRCVARRIDAGACNRHLTGSRLHGVHDVLCALVRRVVVDAEDRDVDDTEIKPPVRDLGVKQAADDVGAEVLGGAGGPGVAVGRRLQRVASADRPGGSALIDDHDFLPERRLDLGRGDAADLVGRSAGGPRHDQRDRLFRLPWVILRGSRAGERNHGSGRKGDDAWHYRPPDEFVFDAECRTCLSACLDASTSMHKARCDHFDIRVVVGSDRAGRAPVRQAATAWRDGATSRAAELLLDQQSRPIRPLEPMAIVGVSAGAWSPREGRQRRASAAACHARFDVPCVSRGNPLSTAAAAHRPISD